MNHILIVDDEAEIRESLEEILREEGYSVASAGTAADALVQARDPVYDVLLLDIWLPDRDGLEVLTELRALDAESRPEVIVISGHATIETAVRATKLGRLRPAGKAADAGAHADRGEERDRGEAAAHREPGISPPAFARTADHRRKRAGTRAAAADQADGAHQRPRAHLRRIRLGQGADRARHPQRKPAQRPRLCGAELRRDSRGLHRERAVRLSQRRHQRRAAGEARNLRARQRRHAVSGRSGRHEPEDPGQGAARPR